MIHRWNSLMQSAEDVMGNSNMKREQFHQSGTCQGATCVGWTAMNVIWDATWQIDKDLGTDYHERVKKYWKYMEDNCVTMAGAITDAKGNRSLKPSQQTNKDSNLHVKEIRSDVQMAVNNEVTYGLGLGAIMRGKKQPSGVFIPDPLLAHANKTQVAKLPYKTKVIAQDISGGIAETGCFPSFKDFQSPEYGTKLFDALTAGADGETRARAARLVEWLTAGGGIPGCMHGGGSPDGARLVVRAMTKWEDYAAEARRIAGITAELTEPAPVKK